MRHADSTTTFAGKRLVLAVMFASLAGFVLLGMRGEAQACGGLFCNAPPPDPFAPLPVAQAGENVVFSITQDPAGGAPTLQAHIQILYTGDAAKFSWVVPVDAEPTLSTGTDRLFSVLANATQPAFVASREVSGTCVQEPYNPTGTGGSFAGGNTTGTAGTTGAAGTGGPGVQVSFQGAVGPFDAAVIKSADSVALRMWLTDNGYIVSDQAVALIDDYVHENKYFVALKLLNGVGVRSIQPIVMTFKGVEACVPLRLTAIAANPDMPVLVWVLGKERVAPRGYYEIKIDEMRLDWANGGGNYFGPTGLVSQAANEAGGNAFVTEYAGTSGLVGAQVYFNGQFDVATLRAAMTPPAYVTQLIAMGLASDTLALPLLAQYIPMPDAVKAMGITESQFYGNLTTYWNQFTFPPYDLAGLTAAIETSIIKPRVDAQMMIDAHPYLTRLNTFISPDEMKKDPFFFETQGLGDVSRVHTAVLRTMCGTSEYMACNAPVRLELPDGQTAWVRAGSKSSTCQWAQINVVDSTNLPALEIAWERAESGEGMRVIDNTSAIQAAVAANNAKYPNEQRMTGADGCGCQVGGAGGVGKIWLATLLGAFVLRVVRRRRRR